MSEQNHQAPAGQARTETERRPWIAPELRTMQAGSAEAGPNPINPEGVFAFASS